MNASSPPPTKYHIFSMETHGGLLSSPARLCVKGTVISSWPWAQSEATLFLGVGLQKVTNGRERGWHRAFCSIMMFNCRACVGFYLVAIMSREFDTGIEGGTFPFSSGLGTAGAFSPCPTFSFSGFPSARAAPPPPPIYASAPFSQGQGDSLLWIQKHLGRTPRRI